MTYHQEISWIEDDHGAVRALVVISDSYEGLFIDLEDSTKTNALIIDNISKSIKSQSGGVETRELKLTINEALIDHSDLAAVEFIKQVEDLSVLRFISVFIDTNTVVASPDDMLFNGLIQSQIESEDLNWENEHFNKDINPKRLLKLVAKPYDTAVFYRFTMNDLIYGNPALQVPGIGTGWESLFVKDRIGQFYKVESGGKIRQLFVDKLVNLNELIRKLADNLTEAILNNGLGFIQIKFDESKLTGKWHPARWRYERVGGEITRYVRSPYRTNLPSYDVYPDDHQELYLCPDGRPEMMSETTMGLHNDEETKVWYMKSPWISYRRVKLYDALENDEPDVSGWKEYKFSKIDNFFTFLIKIANELGMFIKFYWETGTILRVKFVERNLSTHDIISLKTAEKANIKPTTSNIEVVREMEKRYTASYLALDGADSYSKMGLGTTEVFPSIKYEDSESKLIPVLSISPTIAAFDFGRDLGTILMWPYLPHNYSMADNGDLITATQIYFAHGVTTAIYMYCPQFIMEMEDNYTLSYMWAPAGAMSCNVNGVDNMFYSLSDFNRMLNQIDLQHSLYEYSIEVPFLYGAKVDDNISWKHLELLNKLQLDSTWYSIVEVKVDLKNIKVQITLQSISRFSFGEIEYNDAFPPPIFTVIKETNLEDNTRDYILDNIEGISHLDFVSLKDNGEYERALPIASHYHRIIGIAIVRNGIIHHILKKGVVKDDALPNLAINSLLHLRDPGFTPTGLNISGDRLTVSNTNENMICVLAKYIEHKTIEIDEGFNNKYLLEEAVET